MDIVSLAEAKNLGLKHYFTGKPCPRGHVSHRFVSCRACATCEAERAIEVRKTDPDRYRRYTAAWRDRNLNVRILNNARARALVYDARKSSKGRGLECSIQIEDILIPTECPCCGVFLRGGKGKSQECSPSLDRIDNSKGYIRGNVAIICWGCNKRKRDSSVAQLEQLLRYMRSMMAAPVTESLQ